MTSAQNARAVTGTNNYVLRFLLLFLGFCVLSAPEILAQQSDEQTGIDQGNYNIKQSIEFGYRFSNVNGSEATYDTMVNLQQGPRLLGFTTEFRSLDHHATFFDHLYLSNFGYGGIRMMYPRFGSARTSGMHSMECFAKTRIIGIIRCSRIH